MKDYIHIYDYIIKCMTKTEHDKCFDSYEVSHYIKNKLQRQSSIKEARVIANVICCARWVYSNKFKSFTSSSTYLCSGCIGRCEDGIGLWYCPIYNSVRNKGKRNDCPIRECYENHNDNSFMGVRHMKGFLDNLIEESTKHELIIEVSNVVKRVSNFIKLFESK